MAASPAPVDSDPVALWRSSLSALSPVVPPCRYLSSARWGEMRAVALDFVGRFGAEARALGWTAEQLFGVHAEHGTLRLEACGALMIGPRAATGVDARRVLFGHLSAYRDGPGQVWGPPVWVFARRKAL